ncbi:MAG: fatty acid desaturase, partial [Candidatus Krumholzibacteriia bacterium]
MQDDNPSARQAGGRPDLGRAIAPFSRADTRKAVWQLANTIVPYLAILALMVTSRVLGWPYAVTLALAVPAAVLQIRIFIFFHDCCHGS